MKKVYVRPEAFYESYALSQHVAACGWQVVHSNKVPECGAMQDLNINGKPDDINAIIMHDDLVICTKIAENIDMKFYCYTTGTDYHAKALQS